MGLLWRIQWKFNNFKEKLDRKFYYLWWNYPRCAVCKHPLANHVLYHEAPSRFGVCVHPCCLEDEVEHKCDSWNVPLQNKEVVA